MINHDLISVIVPVYNVELYLEDCVRSILSQTYSDLQIILVDDGSTDHSGEICDEYANIDARIIVIHKANGGLSDARNIGIKTATGKYVAFVDSDDCIDASMIEKLYRACDDNDADLSMCFFEKFDEEKTYKMNHIHNQNKIEVCTGKDILADIYLVKKPFNHGCIVIWNKLYKRDLFTKDTFFPYGKIHEDEFVTPELLLQARKAVVIYESLYFYRIRPGSIISKGFARENIDALEARRKTLNKCKIMEERRVCDAVLAAFYSMVFSYYRACGEIENKAERKVCRKMVYDYFEEIWKDAYYRKNLKINRMIIYKAFQVAPAITSFAYYKYRLARK